MIEGSRIHTSDKWIRIRLAKKHVDPVGPDPDPQHCFALVINPRKPQEPLTSTRTMWRAWCLRPACCSCPPWWTPAASSSASCSIPPTASASGSLRTRSPACSCATTRASTPRTTSRRWSATRDGILERHFYSRFLGINSSLLRLEFLSSFLPSFFLSTKWYFSFRRFFCLYF